MDMIFKLFDPVCHKVYDEKMLILFFKYITEESISWRNLNRSFSHQIKKKKKLPLFALLGLVWFAWFGFDLGGYDLGLCWSKKGLVMVLTKCVRHKW